MPETRHTKSLARTPAERAIAGGVCVACTLACVAAARGEAGRAALRGIFDGQLSYVVRDIVGLCVGTAVGLTVTEVGTDTYHRIKYRAPGAYAAELAQRGYEPLHESGVVQTTAANVVCSGAGYAVASAAARAMGMRVVWPLQVAGVAVGGFVGAYRLAA